MITGRKVNEVVADILAAAKAKQDFIVPSSIITMDEGGALTWGGTSDDLPLLPAVEPATVKPTAHAEGQLFDYLDIPRRFADRLKADAPELISLNVNRLLKTKPGERRMLRTIGGKCRALMSDRYRRLDYEDILEHLMPMVYDPANGWDLSSIELTESRLYLQIVARGIEGEIRPGDKVKYGWTLSSSEIGLGALNLLPWMKREICSNGMTVMDSGKRKAHIGGRILTDENGGWLALTDEAQQAADKALWLELRDYVSQLAGEEGFQRVLAEFKARANDAVKGDPILVVDTLANRFNLREAEKTSVLYSFLEEKDHTRWGLANAITAVAKEVPSYDRGIELETMGGKLMALAGSEWTSIATAA